MKATIQVSNRNEAEALKAGLEDPATRAIVLVMGALSELPNDRARARVLTYVRDYFEDREVTKTAGLVVSGDR